MRTKAIVLSALVVCSLGFSGCASKHGLADRGITQYGPNSMNLLGIYQYEGESYRHVGTNTLAVSSDELYSRRNFSGGKATFLWGLFTLKDY